MRIFFITLLAALFLSSCSSDNTLGNIDLTGSQWVISKSTKDGQDITSNFEGYVFDFVDGGLLTATKGGSVIKGNWSRVQDSGKTKLIISFDNPDYFREISEDWVIVKENAEVLELSDGESGSLAGKDVLNFKIFN